MPTLTEQLKKVHYLFLTGALTEAEFAAAKARVIESYVPESAAPTAQPQSAPPPPQGPPQTPPPAAPKTLNPVIPGVGLALGGMGG